jgi:hypothetical protein
MMTGHATDKPTNTCTLPKDATKQRKPSMGHGTLPDNKPSAANQQAPMAGRHSQPQASLPQQT